MTLRRSLCISRLRERSREETSLYSLPPSRIESTLFFTLTLPLFLVSRRGKRRDYTVAMSTTDETRRRSLPWSPREETGENERRGKPRKRTKRGRETREASKGGRRTARSDGRSPGRARDADGLGRDAPGNALDAASSHRMSHRRYGKPVRLGCKALSLSLSVRLSARLSPLSAPVSFQLVFLQSHPLPVRSSVHSPFTDSPCPSLPSPRALSTLFYLLFRSPSLPLSLFPFPLPWRDLELNQLWYSQHLQSSLCRTAYA